MKLFDKFNSFWKTESCGSCDYDNMGLGFCDSCSNLRFPLKDSKDLHSDNYYTRIMRSCLKMLMSMSGLVFGVRNRKGIL